MSGSRASIDELLGPVRRLLVDLMHSTALERGDVHAALDQLTEAATQALRVARTSVWMFSEDREHLECVNLYESASKAHSKAPTLHASDTPCYFRALETERAICADDARTDPRTREFAAAYLVPLGITSMLDAPVLLSGKVAGVVCHEHIGPARSWDAWEELAAGTFADFVAMVFGARERVRQAAELDARRTEEAFKQLFEAAPIALTLSRLADNVVIAANSRTSELFEVPNEEVLGEHGPSYWVDPSERQRLVELVKADGRVAEFEARMRTRSGREFWAHVALRMLEIGGSKSLLFGVTDISAQKQLEDRLRELATMDELTRLLNRRRILEVADEEIARAKRYERALCVAMLDLDHFKDVNDRYGHATGDETLRSVAAVIRAVLRKQDQIGRYGGEELLAVFPETDLGEAALVSERMRSAVEHLVIEPDKDGFGVTVSAGVVQWRSEESVSSIIRRADAALYAAKAAGRNRVVRGPDP